MKKCVACIKDLPDIASHCVFCGVPQPAASAPPIDGGRTVMGYSADAVRANVAAAGGPAAFPQPHAPPQVAAPSMPLPAPMQQVWQPPAQPGPAAPLIASPASMAATMMVGPSPELRALQPQPARSPLAPQPYPPPGASMPFAPAAHPTPVDLQGRTMPMVSPVPPAMMPAMSPTPTVPSPVVAPAPMVVQPVGASIGHGVPMRPLVAAASAPVPARRMTARATPVEPSRTALRVVLLVFGVLLLGVFATPVRLTPTVFNWDALVSSSSTLDLVRTLALVAGGAIAMIVGLIPMPTLVRAVIALGIGLGMIGAELALGPTPEWWDVASLTGGLCVLVGLLLRHDYTESIGARIAVTIGTLTLLATMLIPRNGIIPMIEIINALGSNRTLGALLALLPTLIGVVALLCWLGANTTAGAAWIAWVFLLVPAVAVLLVLAERGTIGPALEHAPAQLLTWVAPTAWMAFAAFGIAGMVGKKLER